MRLVVALVGGLIFGLGLAISEMVNPKKVLDFLDFTGAWDPSLAFVLGGALAVSAIAFRLVLNRDRPVFAARFSLSDKTAIDGGLILGAVLFGIGWGLVGLCPGPAIASLAYGMEESLWFVGALLAGLGVARRIV
jgi:uncharacterized protein